MLWEIYTRRVPYSNARDFQEVKEGILRGQRPDFPVRRLLGYRELVEKCWLKSAGDRPNFEKIFDDLQRMTVNVYG